MSEDAKKFVQVLQALTPQEFEEVFRDILRSVGSGEESDVGSKEDETGIDSETNIEIREPGGYLRREKWAFQLKATKADRVSVQVLHDTEKRLHSSGVQDYDVLCLVTPWPVTSIVKHGIASQPHLRIWDSSHLEQMALDYPELCKNVLERFSDRCTDSSGGPGHVSGSISMVLPSVTMSATGTVTPASKKFEDQLDNVPSGQASYAKYEKVVNDILSHIATIQPFEN